MKRWLGVGAVLLLGFAGTGWIWRADLKARYYTHKLITTADGEAAAWIEQAGAWGEGVPAQLVGCLTADDPAGCARAGAALARLDASIVASRLVGSFTRLSPAGQQVALECVMTFAGCRQPNVMAECRQIVRAALQQGDAGVRLHGTSLAARPEIGEAELLVPLLKDSSPEVRRMAVVAVGPSRSLIADDDLLKWLHDPDADVRRMTEAALRSRGLRAEEVHLGRLLTDPRPTARLELLAHLSNDNELDLSAWLKRLSEDPSPAVRAATARLIQERQVFQLTDRLADMAKSDPDLTVRQTVGFHLLRLQTLVRPASAP